MHPHMKVRPVQNLRIFVKLGHKYRTQDTKPEVCCSVADHLRSPLLCNTKYFYIIDSDGWLNNTHRIHYCFSTATMVTRTRHNVVIHTLPMLRISAQLATALRYKSKGRGFDSRWFYWNF